MMKIIEPRDKTLLFTAYQRLLLRVNPAFPIRAEIEKDFENLKIGYKGEHRIDQAIKETHFTDVFYVLPNVELRVSPHRQIEIDTLILTERFICLFEVKNLKGSLKFNENPYSLHQTINGKIYSYPCPQQQIMRAADSLQYWMRQRFKLNLPIQIAIVLPNQNVLIEKAPTKVKLLSPREIPLFLQGLDTQTKIVSPNYLQQIVSTIKNENSPFNIFPLSAKYNIPINHLRTGIVCPCGGNGIRTTQRTWICNKCRKIINKAIENTLIDWFLLCKPTISNKECSDILQIQNKNTITRILKTMDLQTSGCTRSRLYNYDYKKDLGKQEVRLLNHIYV